MDFSKLDFAARFDAFLDHLGFVMPEVWLVVGMCAVILVPFVRRSDVRLPIGATLASLLLAFITLRSTIATNGVEVFHGMLVIDPFSQFFKYLLIVFTALIVYQWWIIRREQPDAVDTPDFFCLLLGAAFGMALMASANNLLMIVIATEAASLPSFALAGYRKHTRRGTEGSLKYVIFGAAASAIMIYGMSLIYGITGTLSLPGVAEAARAAGGMSPLMAVGVMCLFAGFAFKLSAVPLHFWCPDVFEGAPLPVTTFLSVASKGAAVVMLVRVIHAFGIAGEMDPVATRHLFTGMAVGIGILGAVTATWGNLVAIHQDNLKRMLAYSSIAHAGYMIMGCAAMVYPGGSAGAVGGAILFYLLVYLFMNLGAFTIVGLIAQRTGSEDVKDYAGLIHRSPALAILFMIFVLSLFGMPGLGGFLGKVYVMKAMMSMGPGGFVLIAALLLNTLVSLYFYMRPVYYMVFMKDDKQRPTFPLATGQAVLFACAVALVWTGLGGGSHMADSFANLLSRKAPTPTVGPAVPAIESPATTGSTQTAERPATPALPL